jgi:hypothetical protein
MKKVIYFPKEGDKKCISESYPIGEKGLAFNATIQKLEVLVSAGILRKIETDLIEFKEGETTMETKHTFEQWEKVIAGKKVEAPVEETKEVEVKEAVELPVENILVETEAGVEETKEEAPIASNDVVEAPVEETKEVEVKEAVTVEETKKKGASKKVQQ